MKKLLFLSGTFILAFSLLISSCKKDKDDNTPTGATGTVSGKVIAANGTTPIPNANVFIDVDGEIYLTNSDKSGNFSLVAPAGAQVLNVQTGNGTIFRAQYPVAIEDGQTTTVPDGTLKLEQAANLAYITGYWDEIESVIIDSLGYTADELQMSDLDNLTTLQNYSGLFLNCGKPGAMDSLKYANLKQYVLDGGSIYASDYAVEYLTGDGNAKFTTSHKNNNPPKTTCVGDTGGFINDTTLCTDKIGYTCTRTANILATDLQDYLGATTVDVTYDLSSWEVIQVVTSPWEVLLEDPLTWGSLAVRMTANGSNMKTLKLMEQGWVTICHIPPGNPGNAHTITISVNAWPAHQAHGDYIGTCQGGGTSGGNIYFTTFHNHVQGTISQDVQHMLEYFVLNL
ncbi:MAG: hypothetical protein V1904_01340 [Bacteroidota bacterium]